MKSTTRYGRGTARSTPWAPQPAYVKKKVGNPDEVVSQLGSFSCSTSGTQLTAYDEPNKPDVPRSCRVHSVEVWRELRIGSVNVGTLTREMS